ncbi:hypothetical protein [Thioclava pacifica]|uniref:Methyltransferase domain-containing protein n=1 Tax=Thioclava pacifica DSM 10166 TaxID=1353537 RepID=A0A074JGK3_9RHOB|nr:hypothetical protein [Thioclava pacifica]KEO54698.1 hypothetical protein TP2_17335 [Thioclava pacifica DSM 10166]
MFGLIKSLIVGSRLEGPVRALLKRPRGVVFSNSGQYWDERYQAGGNSGSGSYGRLASFKASVLNDFVESRGIASVIEFSSGDGHQLSLASYPSYVGVDVSDTAVEVCRQRFTHDPTKSFMTTQEYDGERRELPLSLDVIYHLVEDEVFEGYMNTLFQAAERFVIVYASDEDRTQPQKHVRHRKFSDWVAQNRRDFRLVERIPNKYPFDPERPDDTSFADFFIFEAQS